MCGKEVFVLNCVVMQSILLFIRCQLALLNALISKRYPIAQLMHNYVLSNKLVFDWLHFIEHSPQAQWLSPQNGHVVNTFLKELLSLVTASRVGTVPMIGWSFWLVSQPSTH